MADAEVRSGEMSTIEAALSPARIAASIKGRTNEELVELFGEAKRLGARAWMAAALLIAEAQARAGYGDDALGHIASAFGIHRAHAGRLGKIARETILPRIAAQGDDAVFELDSQSFYRLAVEAAPIEKLPPAEVLEKLEHRVAEDPSISARRLRAEYGLSDDDEGSTTSEAPAFDRLLGKLSRTEDSVIDEWVSHADVKVKLSRVQDAFTAIDRALRGLRERFATEKGR